MRTFDADHERFPEGYRRARRRPVVVRCVQIDEPFQVGSLDGVVRGSPGDWLMEGVRGEMYVCHDALFHQTYELINEDGDG
jgi:hypothetical protein